MATAPFRGTRATRRQVAGLLIALDASAAVNTLQQQVCAAVRAAILDGTLAPGSKLPSSRALAQDLKISRTTTLLAYEQLTSEGYLQGRRGSGTFVARELPDDLPQTRTERRRLRATPPSVSRRGFAIGSTPKAARRLGGPPRPFRIGVPALDLFPVRLWAQLAGRRLRSLTMAQLDYGEAGGLLQLRECIAEHVSTTRGTRCEADQVVVTAGAQGGLNLICRVLLDPGDRVWMEEPGYSFARGALVGADARVEYVPVDEEGLDVSAGRRRAPDARLAYVTPSHQYPTGVQMSLRRRLDLLRWASGAQAWVLEDDYDSEFRYGTRPVPCLHGLDVDGRVVYVGTFAKTLFPGLRLGFLIVPPGIADLVRAARRACDVHPPRLEQAVLADFIAHGHYATHLRRMRSAYRERLEALVAAANEYCDGVLAIRPTRTGLHVVADLEGADAEEVSAAAARDGLEILPLSACYASRRVPSNALVLGFGSQRPDDMPEAMRRLAAAIEIAARTNTAAG